MALRRITPGVSDKLVITKKQKLYSDLDLTFAAKTGSLDANGVRKGDVFKKTDTAAVIQSVSNILQTNYFEKPFNPFFGANLRAMLFENMENFSTALITDQIIKAVRDNEPRAEVEEVEFFEDSTVIGAKQRRINAADAFFYTNNKQRNAVTVIVKFRIENSEELVTATVNMNRLR